MKPVKMKEFMKNSRFIASVFGRSRKLIVVRHGGRIYQAHRVKLRHKIDNGDNKTGATECGSLQFARNNEKRLSNVSNFDASLVKLVQSSHYL